MLKKSKKVFAGLLCLIMMMTLIPGNFVFGEESAPENDYLGVARKSQYVLYASSKENGIQLNGKNYVINGNVHSNSDVAAYLDKLDVRGKLETSGKVINYNNGVTQYIKKENAPERVLIDPSKYIVDSLGANAKVYENWTSLSDSTLENTEPIQAKSGLQFSASVIKLKNTIMSNGNMLVNASETFVSPENEEVLLYSANGDIQVSAQNVEINGIIYAPNGTVQIGGTNVKINGMIIAKKIQIGANNKLIINQNLNLKNAEAFKYYNDELQIYSEAEYDDTTETINVNWESTFDEGKYEVYSSTDNKNFTLLGTVTGANTYAYKTNGSTNDIYFKVKQTLNNGFTKESNTVKMVYDVYKCQYVFEDTDTDNEKLTDTYEFFLETDMNNVDTDGDELSDYFEVFLTGTDPLYKDSDEDGVLDCDEDTDGDTLSNKYEMKLGTHPQKVDTDDDTLADNYEVVGIKIKGDDVNTYKTLPTNADTDDDTLSDSDEALLGLNPLSKDSDGDGILDCDEMFKQKVEPLEIENPNSAVKEVNLDINIAGNAEKNVEMESVMGKDTYSSAVVGLIGEPIRIEAKTKFDTATLTFKIDKTKLGSTDFNDIQMMWYNEDTGFYEYFNTIHDEANGTVSTKTNHFCTILLVNGKVFEESFSKDLYSQYKDTYTTKYEFNTIIAVDCSNNMIDIDPSRAIPGFDIKASNRLEIVTNILKDLNQYPKNKVSICTFNWDCFKRTDFINSYPSGSLQLASFISDFLYENFDAHYGVSITQMVNILKQNSTTRKEGNITYQTISKIIFISDGKEGIDEDTQNALNYARQNNIVIDTISVPATVSAPINETALQKIATDTRGTFYKDVNERSLLVEYDGPTTTNYNFTADVDNDKIPDTFEEAGMLCSNGEVIKTKYKQENGVNPQDNDNDTLKDGEEIQLVPFDSLPSYIQRKAKTYFVDGVPSQYIFKKISDPHKIDSDGDGYEDSWEIKIYQSNPLHDDVEEVDLLHPYIQVDCTNNVNWTNSVNLSSISYGGAQVWLSLRNPNSYTKNVNSHGCGIISCMDTVLYLYLYNNNFSKGTFENYFNPKQYIQKTSTLFNNISITNNSISFNSYCDSLQKLIDTGMSPTRFGLDGRTLAGYFKRFKKLDADFRLDQDKMLERIEKSLKNDIPVPFLIDQLWVDRKIHKGGGVFFKDHNPTIPTDKNNGGPYDYKAITQKDKVNQHFVTITGIINDDIKNKTYLRISSWGSEYFIDYEELKTFIDNKSNGLISNIIEIRVN